MSKRPTKTDNFRWDKKKRLAAQRMAEKELADHEIAEEAGVHRSTLYEWRKHPEFMEQVDSIASELGELYRRRGIGLHARRLAALQDRWERMQRVIEQRASDPKFLGVPGGDTGLLVHMVKGVGKGDNFQLIDLYAVDTALLKEMREHEKQAAIELGQWTEKKEVKAAVVNWDELTRRVPEQIRDPASEALEQLQRQVDESGERPGTAGENAVAD